MKKNFAYAAAAARIGLAAVLLAVLTGAASPLNAARMNGRSFQAGTIGYQAALNGSDGKPVSDGSYSMLFRLLPDSTGTLVLWEESRSVQVAAGHFSVYLGEVVPIPDSVFESATHLQVTVNGELMNPPVRLSSSPSSHLAGTARSLKGDLVELTGTVSGGRLGIWGTNGTNMPSAELVVNGAYGSLNLYPGHEWLDGTDTAIAMNVSPTGGRLSIWGSNGTNMPLAELIANNGNGSLNLYPGSEWLAGTDTAVSMTVSPSGGRLGIWGSNGTNLPQVELNASSLGGRLGIWGTEGTSMPLAELIGEGSTASLLFYPGHEWKAAGDTALELTCDSAGGRLSIWGTNGTALKRAELVGTATGGQLGIWGTTGTTIPRALMTGDDFGGAVTLCDSNDIAKIVLDARAWGDASVQLPLDAVNAYEIEDESGFAETRETSCVTVETTVMQDLATVTINLPADGYVILTGTGMVEFGGTTSLNRIDVQIDETSGGGSTNGYFERIGLADYVGTGYSSFSFSVRRTYYMSTGPHTFRLEARRMALNGTASVCWPVVTAMFVPTSYGSVNTVAAHGSNSEMLDAGASAVADLTGSSNDSDDLRDLELRAREARLEALKAELRLSQARLRESQR